jgi:hypothetical protein
MRSLFNELFKLFLFIFLILGLSSTLYAADEAPPAELVELTEIVIHNPVEDIALQANPGPIETLGDLDWKMTHTFFNILSDVAGLVVSTTLVATQFDDNPLLFPVGAAIASGYFTIDLFRGFEQRLAAYKEAPSKVATACYLTLSAGQVISVAGLSLLATKLPPEVGVCILLSGVLIKFGALSTELSILGLEKTFGNDNNIRNGVFKVGCLGVGGTIATILIASGIITANPEVTSAGLYIFGISIFAGTAELMIEDIQEMIDTHTQRQLLRAANGGAAPHP